MADAIVALNAGSSSIKFSSFASTPSRRRWCSAGRSRASAPPRASSPRIAAGATARDPDLGRRRAARRTTARSASCSTACTASSPATGCAPSAIASCTAAPTTIARCASTRRWSSALERFIPLAPAAPAAQPRRDPRDARARAASCRRSPASTPRSTARSRRSRSFRAAAGDHRPRRAPLRLPRPVLRVHRRDAAAARRRGGARAASSSRTWATAPPCAPCEAAAASPRRWASPPSRA